MLEGIHDKKGQDRVLELFRDLFAVLNGDWFAVEMHHFCTGRSCCLRGKMTTVEKLIDIILLSLLRARPITPVLSRWSKPVGSLDFWVPVFACYNLIADLFNRAFLHDICAMGGDDSRGLIERMDFKATQNKRIKICLDEFIKATTFAVLLILCIMLAPLRYIAKWLQRSTRVARINRGARARPPALDATNPVRSHFITALQFLSSLVAARRKTGRPLL